MPDDQPRDLVDSYLTPVVRPLGNIVILYAHAEAALRDFVMYASGQSEVEAHRILSTDWQTNIAPLIERCGLDQFTIQELHSAVADYAKAREERNRLAHDEWHLLIDGDGRKATVATRGLKGRKGAELVHGEPSVDALWQLARRFRAVGKVFESAAYHLRWKIEHAS